ncbi:hypothetical protein [Marinomonas sp. ef1]|uniref:hypothetical protein n=1 Tax=Marinomonas sp. ef1 TaxID=2005043 RepID=UPI0012FE22D5|nr:hypothetical protein [Marinomonas sp. ef1]
MILQIVFLSHRQSPKRLQRLIHNLQFRTTPPRYLCTLEKHNNHIDILPENQLPELPLQTNACLQNGVEGPM